MIDVALTGLYDVCLFNSAAQVLFVRSGHGNPSDGLCALTSGWFEFFSGIWLFWVLSAKVFLKRQLKFYNGHLIWLLCVLCQSYYGNESPLQSIKVHQTISDVILGEGVRAQRQVCQSTKMQVEFEGMLVTRVFSFLSFADMLWAPYMKCVLWNTVLQCVYIALIIGYGINMPNMGLDHP